MLGFRKAAAGFLAAGLRSQVVPRATVVAKPAKHPLSAVEQGIGLVVLFSVFLIPSGWIMANIDHYKERPE